VVTRFLICLLIVVAPLAATDVEALQKELAAKQAALAGDDVEGRHKLAAWCKLKKLRQSELRIYREIVKLAPADEAAREALGHVLNGETWHESFDAMQLAKGKVRRLTEWADAVEGLKLRHDYRLTEDELAKLETGEPLQGHAREDWHEVITREYRITSRLKPAETLELARVLEQAIRVWRDDASLPYEAAKSITLEIDILKTNKDFIDMMKADVETFSEDMYVSQGFFDGQACRLSYFHDWWRTRQIILHEGRHQFDLLVAGKLWQMPAWYKEGTAEYWAMHTWDGKKLEMGQLAPDENYSLHFCGKLLKKKKIKGAEDTLNQGWWGVVEPEFYQNSWAFIYYLRNSDSKEGFRKFEKELLAQGLDSQAKQLEAFKSHVNADLKAWDKGYWKQLAEWAAESPENMR
jgi:hypothetical protein